MTQQPQAPASLGEQLVAGMIDGMKQYNADPEAYENARFDRSMQVQPVVPAGVPQLPALNPDGSLADSQATPTG